MSEASGDYIRGEMDVKDQEATYAAFMKLFLWSGLILLLAIGYATFTLTMGVHWLPALIGFTVAGGIIGMILNLGAGWLFTLVGLAVTAVFVQVLIWLGGALVS